MRASTVIPLITMILVSTTAAFGHEFQSPGVIFADEDGGFEGEFVFRAGPSGAVPLGVEIFYGPNAGDIGVAADMLCLFELEPGQEERVGFSGSLTDPTLPGRVDARFSTNCPDDPEPGLLFAAVTILPRFEPCESSPHVLCLHDGRFRVEVEWRDFQDGTGRGRAVPLAGLSDSGLFWFFGPRNIEILVKVLDGCLLNGHFWVFLASASNVAYDVRVTDLSTRETWTHQNPLGEIPSLVPDTTAFGCLGAGGAGPE